MLWVWVVPFLILLYVVIDVPTLTPHFISAMAQAQAGANQSSVAHYLGWGCQPKDGCFDETVVTMPFYASIAYSVGAWVAQIGRHSVECKVIM